MSILTRARQKPKYGATGQALYQTSAKYLNIYSRLQKTQKGMEENIASGEAMQEEMEGSEGYQAYLTAKEDLKTARTGAETEGKAIQKKIDARVAEIRSQTGSGTEALRTARQTWRQAQKDFRTESFLTDDQKNILKETYSDWEPGKDMLQTGYNQDPDETSIFKDVDYTYGAGRIISFYTGMMRARPKLYEKLGGKELTKQLQGAQEKYKTAGETFYGKDGVGGAIGAYQSWANEPTSWKEDLEGLTEKYGLEDLQSSVKSAYEGDELKGYRTNLAEMGSRAEDYQRQAQGYSADLKKYQSRITELGGDVTRLGAVMQDPRKRGTRQSAFRTTTLTSRSPYRY